MVKARTFPLTCVSGEDILENFSLAEEGFPPALAWQTEVCTLSIEKDGGCTVFDGLLVRGHILVTSQGIPPHEVRDVEVLDEGEWETIATVRYDLGEFQIEVKDGSVRVVD